MGRSFGSLRKESFSPRMLFKLHYVFIDTDFRPLHVFIVFTINSGSVLTRNLAFFQSAMKRGVTVELLTTLQLPDFANATLKIGT